MKILLRSTTALSLAAYTLAGVGADSGDFSSDDYGLDPKVAPSGNFDLLGWYLGVPVPDDDGFASEVYEADLSSGYESEYFYTGADGAMVFWTNGYGVTTSLNTKYIRSELREMIRRGETSIGSKDKANNWAFSSIPDCAQPLFGGIDGELTATLAVNHVMTTGTDLNWQGRIIIGQIHAENNEPCRLYYQKLPNNTKGALYFGHELSVSKGGDDFYYNLLGNMAHPHPEDQLGVVQDASDPEDGMALDEIFSYSILVEGNYLTVTISQDGVQLAQQIVDMTESGYDEIENYQYFKAGLYLQDNTFELEDYAQVSFYELEYTHNYDLYAGSGKVPIVSASDWGGTMVIDGLSPSGVFDGSRAWATRWEADLINGVDPVNLLLDVGSDEAMTGIGISWGKGDDYYHIFEIYTQMDGSDEWTMVYAGNSSGLTEEFDTYPIDEVVARYVRIQVLGNEIGVEEQIIKEIEIYYEVEGCPTEMPSAAPSVDAEMEYGLDPEVAPSGNFDLLGWYLGVPVPDDDGYASEISEIELSSGYESEYFYTGDDGAMVFWTNGYGVRTSENTKYLRSELRAMLRRGDTTIGTKDPANNWAFSSIPECAQPAFGGIDGELTATLAVDHVMTTGTDLNWSGRVIIGQIHAEDNEPCRLYYQKLPNNTRGGIYFGHELSVALGGDDFYYNLLGNMAHPHPEDQLGVVQDASDPEDGIALGEIFSYSILVEGNYLTVTILQDGVQLAQQVVDMSNSGYGVVDDFQYFKAGLYLQDYTFDPDDYAQVSFYELSYTHNYDLYAGSGKVAIDSASDWGGTVPVDGQSASGAIDGSTAWATRWAANLINGTEAVNLLLDVGSDKAMTGVGVAWGKGDDYSHIFEIRYQVDGGSDWIKVYSGSSSGTTESIESYDIGDVVARYIRIKIFGNTANETVQIIKEIEIYNEIEGCPSSEPSAAPSTSGSESTSVDYGLDANVPPSENFDLLGWYLGVPVPDDDGYASEISEIELSSGYESEYFYTGDDGAMVFWTNGYGVRTSENTKYLRSELRAMLRRGDTTIGTKDPANNWAFSSIPECAQPAFGGIDGELTATLAVDHVMTTGTDLNWSGRVIIGQIHAEDNEPCRLYYQKLPNNTRGGIYFGHELSVALGGDDFYYNLLGNMAHPHPEDQLGVVQDASDPEDGIALGEIFSYSILVEGNYLTVTILQDGVQLAQQVVDMSNSGYGVVDDFQYFKAGLYLQDYTFDPDDYAQVSFYELSYTHNYDLYAGSGKVAIDSASDWGGTVPVDGQSASGAIDGSTAWATRWAANLINGTEAVNLLLDVGSDKAMTGVGVAWGKGDDYSHIFEIRYQVDGGSDWIKVYSGSSSGTTESIESYDIGDVVARYIRIKIFGNTANETVQIIKEIEIYNEIEGCPSSEPSAAPSTSGSESTSVDYGLDANVPPSENFDLLGWYLGVPVPDDDGYASEISEIELSSGYESEYFYTGDDGAMVFWTNGYGVRTSENTKYLRSELRAMLRRGDTTIGTKDPANNWAFSSIPECAQPAFGGIDGELTATLAVDHVMTTGTDLNWSGRVIIGQIHAEDNEPCRLYYQKLPNNTRGGIYFGHELSVALGGDDFYYNLLGNMAHPHPEDQLGVVQDASDPEDGIALGEIFSYSILVEGNYLTVTILQDGVQLAQQVVDMSNSGYGVVDDFQYFKAGLYLQDYTFDPDDYAQVSFYELSYTHNYDLYAGSGKVAIDSASDWGGTVPVDGQSASGAIDGSTAWATRWAANLINGTEAVNLLLDVGSDKAMTGVGVAWGKGDDYSHIFEIRYQVDGGSDWIKVYSGSSSGTTESIESYDIGDVVARYIRIKIFGNTANETVQIIKEIEIYNEIEGCPSSEPSAAPSTSGSESTSVDYGLDANVPPSENFDLLGWYLGVPVPDDDGYASEISEIELSSGYESEYFYTGDDGAMVFWTNGYGVRTSENTKYLRSELRAMLRRGDTTIGTKDPANNWAFSSIPECAQPAFGGIDGELTATLAVDHVMTTGTDLNWSGRVIIGQIHAEDNEPCRLYYQKLPNNTRGGIYFGHELSVALGGDDFYYNLLGNMAHPHPEDQLGVVQDASDPEDGIALGEIFSYSILVEGNYLTVTILQDGVQLAQQVVDMSNSGYGVVDDFQYFKAGLYLQDYTFDPDDYAQVSFYELSYTHNYDLYAGSGKVAIDSASDWGGTVPVDGQSASGAIDGSTAWATRWAANLINGTEAVNLLLDVGSDKAMTGVGVAWGKGDDYSHIFEIRYQVDGGSDWIKVYSGSSSGTTESIETYDIGDVVARYIRIKIFGNTANETVQIIKEIEIYNGIEGCP